MLSTPSDGCATHGSPAHDVHTLEKKMLVPRLCPGVEDRRHSPECRVNCGQVGSFSPVAFEARESKVAARGLPPVPDGNDVVYLMGEWNVVLMDAAVFAAAPGSLGDQGSQFGGDRCPAHRVRPKFLMRSEHAL
jgi:hypothetical protein